MQDTQPTLGDFYGTTVDLLKIIKQIGDPPLTDLAKVFGHKAAALTVESPPDDVRAVCELVDTLDAAIRKLADEINAIEDAQDAEG